MGGATYLRARLRLKPTEATNTTKKWEIVSPARHWNSGCQMDTPPARRTPRGKSPLLRKHHMNNKLLHRTTLFAAAIALAVPTAATLGQDNANQNRGQDQSGQVVITGQERAGENRQQAGQMPQEEAEKIAKMFFEAQASGNQFEIEAAKLAEERASDEQVKQVAQTIMQGHQKALEALRQEAQAVGVEVSQNPELNEVHSAALEALRQKQGKEFDRAYIFEMDAAHLETVLLLSHVESMLPNDSAKAYAGMVLPHVKMHSQELDQLASKMSGYKIDWEQNGQARTAGAAMEDRADRDRQNAGQQDQRQQDQQDQQGEVDPEKWFKHVASMNQYEYETAQLATEMSKNPQVKAIAQQIERDHQKAMEMLMKQAEQAGVEIPEEPELMPVHQAKLDMLKQMDGPAFDAHYVFGAAAGHRKGLLECTWSSKNAGDEAVRAYAGDSLQVLKQHQQQLKPIAKQMSGQGMSGDGQGGDMPPMDRPGNRRGNQQDGN